MKGLTLIFPFDRGGLHPPDPPRPHTYFAGYQGRLRRLRPWLVTDHQIDRNRRAESVSDQIWKYTWPHPMVTATVLIVLRERIRFVPVVSSGVRARSVAWGFVRSWSPNFPAIIAR